MDTKPRYLVVCEKDMVARDCCRALTGRAARGGWPCESGDYVFVPAQGHLLATKEPAEVDARWADRRDMSVLPIPMDGDWPKKPVSELAAKRIEDLGRCLDAAERVYCCGDADDEGQLIVDELIEYLGHDPSDPRFWRVFVNDNLDQNIRRAFEEAVPNAEHVGAGKSALARQIGDLCYGVNESRIATYETGERADIGRVQTPTLALVAARDAAIEQHAERDFYVVEATVALSCGDELSFTYKPDPAECEDGKHMFDKEAAERIAAAAERAGALAFAVEASRKAKEPPLPFNMTSLVKEASAARKMTAQDVMDVSQALRDRHRAITYNRSSSSYLKDEHFDEGPQTTEMVMESLGRDLPVSFDRRRKAFDSSKVNGHHGIIPQAIALDLDAMGASERALYEMIAERYLAQFLPDISYVQYAASFRVDGCAGEFAFRRDVATDYGYAEHVLKSDGSRFSGAPVRTGAVDPGDVEGVSASVLAKKTSPPKRYTDGTLMADMAAAAKFVRDPEMRRALKKKDEDSPDEHGSIGTAATRASIIEGLVEKGYLERKGGSLVSTETGRALVSIVPMDAKSIDLTAKWYLIQLEVAAGRLPVGAVAADAAAMAELHKSSGVYRGKRLSRPIGTCPVCGRPVVAKARSYPCSSNRYERDGSGEWARTEGCGFSLPGKWGGKKVTAAAAAKLLSGKKAPLKGCVSKKTGKRYDVELSLKPTGSIECSFPEKKGGPKGKGRPKTAKRKAQ